LHARFLGGDGAVMRCLYPTDFHPRSKSRRNAGPYRAIVGQ